MTFECATNLTGYSLTFSYGDVVNAHVIQTDLAGGGKKITATFDVTNANNGINIFCLANKGIVYKATKYAYAYAQGK